jgi:quercetin dioxygenase-like cupin family protein
MTKAESLLVSLGALALFVLAGASPLLAQDPAKVNSHLATVRVENDQVRVLDVVLQPGDKENLHVHPAAVLYVVSGGKLRVHAAEGTVVDKILTRGDVAYRGPVALWTENVGKTPVHVIVVELKTPGDPSSSK